MKIISVDNYNREIQGVSDDRFVAFIQNEERARKIVDLLNEEDHDSIYFRCVSDDYELRKYDY